MNILYILFVALFLLFVVTNLYRKKKGRAQIVSIIDANCSRCGSCVRKCKHNVLSFQNNENGKYVMVEHPALCSGCGHCMEVCRFDAIEMIKR